MRLHRDRLTWAGYALLATWAWFLYSFGALLPLLRAEQATSRTVMGLHSFALATGAVLAGPFAVRIVRSARRRGAIRIGVGLFLAGVGTLAVGGTPLATLPAVLLVGIGGSIMINAVNPGLSDHHGERAAPAVLSEANAVAAGVGVVAPLAVAAAVGLGLTWRPAALAVVPLGGLAWWLLRRVPAGVPALDAAPPSTPAGPKARLGRRFWLLAAALVIGAGIEFANTAWAADLLHLRTGMSQGASAIGVTAILTGATIGRLSAGRLALRFAPRALLLTALAITAGGWLVTWTTTSATVALAGLVATGLGISGSYPLGLSLVYAAVGPQTDRASGIISLGIGVFAAVTPFTLGALADASSTHTAFLIVPVLVVAGASCMIAAGEGAEAGRATA